MLTGNLLLYGSSEPLPERISLRAGPLTLLYEAGDLRNIALDGVEVLRRVYVAVRDRNWGTVPAKLRDVQIEVGADSFAVSYVAEHVADDVDFLWRGAIVGQASGTLVFRMEGECRATFWRNRIGFNVLHPMACAGQPCVVEHVDGRRTVGTFPRTISPHQPFKEVRAIRHAVRPGVWASVRMEGDTFEMEDQRNWTDASYKTYSTPLELPFPVQVERGTRITQTVTLSLEGAETSQAAQQGRITAPLVLALSGEPPRPMPRLGLGMASDGAPRTARELERLQTLRLSHLRVDLDLSAPDVAGRLREATRQVRALGTRLQAALFLSQDAERELDSLRQLLADVQPPVCAWLVFAHGEEVTGGQWLRLARRYLRDAEPTAQFVGGTNAYFTQLNRQRPAVADLDAVAYSLNPQVHAFDNYSLVENLAGQAATVESARRFVEGRPLIVSPVTLRPRFNPAATGPEPEPAPGELPTQVDTRQMSLFGACWTLGSLKYLGESGAYSATYYETIGWRGVMEREAGSPLPDRFPSIPGAVFPLYHVLADVGEFRDGQILPSACSDPLTVEGLVLQQGERRRVLLANLTPMPQRVMVRDLPAVVRVRMLDDTNAQQAMCAPAVYRAWAGNVAQPVDGVLTLDLRPYAVARLDGVME
ncbi:MAG: hypothetical protein GX552_15410 [Chloroflexi bacterium]|jgi:hypothetical protein|nr:hypothetical protein [Chloroflexota bacterium]